MMKKLTLLLIPLLLIASTLACNLSSAADPGNNIPDGRTENFQPQAASVQGSWSYSPAQQAVLQEYGNPTRCTIIFANNTRQETWTWDTTGRSIVFIDGEQAAEKTFAAEYQDNLYRTTYGPDQFFLGMTIDDIVFSTGRNTFLLSTVEGVGRLMHLEGLSIGLSEDRISFVETYPAAAGPQLMPEDFTAAAVVQPPESQDTAGSGSGSAQEEPAEYSLTPAEADNAGLHNYESIIYLDAMEIARQETSLESTFNASGLEWTENGETIQFTRTESNFYTFEEIEGMIYVTFLPEGPVMFFEEEGSTVEIVFTRPD
jgi:hypothetical protein